MAWESICCLKWHFGTNTGHHEKLNDLPIVQLDSSKIGSDVVIVKNGRRICGTGGALANAPIHQNKAYFEAKVQSSGVWGIGLGTRNCDLNAIPLGTNNDSWVLRQDGLLFHGNEEKSKMDQVPQEGDIIGFAYDHIEAKYFLNGQPTSGVFAGFKGTLYPLLYVADGAIMDVQFSHFYHTPPDGFEEIMVEKSLL